MNSKPSWLGRFIQNITLSYLPLGVLTSLLFPPIAAYSEVVHQTYAQVGFEYDSNVFKTFGGGEDDLLTRLLITNKGRWQIGDRFRLRWKYQGGGKKFFKKKDQDLLIQYLEGIGSYRFSDYVSVDLRTGFKFQDERDSIDPASVDINEDFFSSTTKSILRSRLPFKIHVEPFVEYTFFKFFPQDNFSFHRERFGIMIKRLFHSKFMGATFYNQTRQQFESSSRSDILHEVGAMFQYVAAPFLSLRYAYQHSESNDDIFSFRNHRISFLLSFPLLEQREEVVEDTEENGALLGLHLLGTVQRKRFPAIFGTGPEPTSEGQRFLLTDSEDDNFNSTLIKLTLHPTRHWAIEGKYTIYSNALSSQESNFNRSLFYLGARYIF